MPGSWAARVCGLRGGGATDREEDRDLKNALTKEDKKKRTPLKLVMEQQRDNNGDSAKERALQKRCDEIVWLLNKDLHWQRKMILSCKDGDEAGVLSALDNGAQADGHGDPFEPVNTYDPQVVYTPSIPKDTHTHRETHHCEFLLKRNHPFLLQHAFNYVLRNSFYAPVFLLPGCHEHGAQLAPRRHACIGALQVRLSVCCEKL